MPAQIPATFLIPDQLGVPLDITFRHDALKMAVVDRDQFTTAVARPWDVTGIYLLFAPSAEDAPGRYAVYVGKAAPGSIAGRVRDHIRNREGWDRALLVTRTTAEGFTSTDVGWLEGRLHEMLVAATDAELLNSATPGDDTISAWDREALERVSATVQGVMRVLGYRPDPQDRVAGAGDDAPAPRARTVDADQTTTGLDTELLHRVIGAVEPGEWTTYGDVAEVVGSHPRALGSHIRACSAGTAEWRVLNKRGTSQPGFVWGMRAQQGSQIDVLAREGVRFDDDGRADPDQRIDAEALLRRTEAESSGDAARSDVESRAGGWLTPLYAAGVLSLGSALIGRYKGDVHVATANADGEVEAVVAGERLSGSPSYVARAIVGYEINGWTFWRSDRGGTDAEQTLAQLRDAVEAM